MIMKIVIFTLILLLIIIIIIIIMITIMILMIMIMIIMIRKFGVTTGYLCLGTAGSTAAGLLQTLRM